jgi:hypothetical protein
MNEAALLSSGHGTHQQYRQHEGQAAARNLLGLRQPFVVATFLGPASRRCSQLRRARGEIRRSKTRMIADGRSKLEQVIYPGMIGWKAETQVGEDCFEVCFLIDWTLRFKPKVSIDTFVQSNSTHSSAVMGSCHFRINSNGLC